MTVDSPYPREGEAPAPLEGIRVLDVTTTLGEMAGRVLADLGAEVIKIEPPGGADARHLPPFNESESPRRGESLYWASVGRGKKSVMLDLTCGPDRDALLKLAATADVFLESYKPGFASTMGFGYDVLSEANPALVYASISPFGQDGPLAKAPATELTIEAAGGLVSLQGDGDRPNVPVGFPQAGFHAGAQAACDVVIALYERNRSGLGQYLDISAQAAMVWTLMSATGYPPNVGANPPGTCENRHQPAPSAVPGLAIPRLWECRDGGVSGNFTLAGVGPRTFAICVRWMREEGALPAHLAGLDFSNWAASLAEGSLQPAQIADAMNVFWDFLKTRSKFEVQEIGAREGAIMSAIYDIGDLLADPHLKARDFWRSNDGYTHPGPFIRFSSLALADTARAPSLGEHQSLLDEERPAIELHGSGTRTLAFEGLKVADFAWVGVGPMISRALADHGATVVHIESATHPDVLRQTPPFKDDVPGLDRSQFMANFNTSKLGLACDLSKEEGRELAQRVIDWSDVVVESFTPGTMARFGFDYASIAKKRPDIVMLSTCLRGQTGPEATFSGFGGQGAALAGIHSITGWPDRVPAGPWGAYTDFINPRFGIPSLVAALMYRDRTGKGTYLDLAQTECGMRFIEPLVLDYTVNGRIAEPAGHDSLYAAPHTVVAAEGHERYIAISCETATQWRALQKTLKLEAFADRSFAALEKRLLHKHEIEDAIRAWSADRDPFAAVDELRAAGVPASVVLRPSDLYDDPQLSHREFFVTLDHPEMGPTPYDGLVTKFSATPGRLASAAPTLGQHTDFVLRDVLGLTDDEVLHYAMQGVLS